VGHWEVVLSSAYQAWRLITLGQRTFEPDDGSIYQRLNLLYNRSKHVESAIMSDPPQLPEDGTLAVWLKNDGLHCSDGYLTFEEVAEFLESLARVADAVQDPPTMVERLTAIADEVNAAPDAKP
jgi:hypothetical protein